MPQERTLPRATSPVSFRDPEGILYLSGAQVFRTVEAAKAEEIREFLQSRLCAQLTATGSLVKSRVVSAEAVPFHTSAPLILEHEPVWFPSYASEWAPEMLHAAASLTLDIMEGAIAAGFSLKDATPNNVLFRGSEPQFVDVLSFFKRDPGDPHWLAFAQFSRTFLLPLLACREFGLPLSSTFLQFRDGLEPEQLYRMCSWFQRFKPSMLRMVSLPKCLNGLAESKRERLYVATRVSPDRAEFTLQRLVKSCRTLLEATRPLRKSSTWARYPDLEHARDAEQAKTDFVTRVVGQDSCRTVLDIGCNTGNYSAAAAKAGAKVVAVDSDTSVVGATWRMARSKHLDVLPLVVNIARPTPPLGWRNREQFSFLDRATGKFDCVLMLGIIHHLLVSERVPLDEIIALAAHLATRTLVLEFVPRSDPMFRFIARGRDALHEEFTREAFEREVRAHFDIVSTRPVPGGERVLYWLSKVS